MPILNRLTLTAAAAAIALAVPKPGLAETNMLFILDGSNSMWGQVEGKAKIKTAQDVLADLIADLPKDTKVELISPLKKASLTGFHATAKHIAAKAVSPSSETMRTI